MIMIMIIDLEKNQGNGQLLLIEVETFKLNLFILYNFIIVFLLYIIIN